MNRKLYIGNLAYAVTEDELKQECARFGAVRAVNVVTDRRTGVSKGFGFVEFENAEDAHEAVVGLHEKEFHGRRLNVSEAKAQA